LSQVMVGDLFLPQLGVKHKPLSHGCFPLAGLNGLTRFNDRVAAVALKRRAVINYLAQLGSSERSRYLVPHDVGLGKIFLRFQNGLQGLGLIQVG
jgi:hypothetical protein